VLKTCKSNEIQVAILGLSGEWVRNT
jgi:hypothetical protein